MTKKLLLLSAAFLLFSAMGLAEEKQTFEPTLPQNPAGQVLLPFQPMLDCTSNYIRGDLNESGYWDYYDAVAMINCLFADPRGWHCLPCLLDMNCDHYSTPVDLVILLRFTIDAPIFEINRKCPN